MARPLRAPTSTAPWPRTTSWRGTRPQGTAQVRLLHPDARASTAGRPAGTPSSRSSSTTCRSSSTRSRWSSRASCATCTSWCTPTSTWSATSPASSSRCSPSPTRAGSRPTTWCASRGCTSRSTGSARATTPTRSSRTCSGCCATCVRPSRTGRRCTSGSARSSTELRPSPPVGIDPEELRQSGELLTWLADGHFTFLGYREYVLDSADIDGDGIDDDVLRAVPGSGLGILRSDQTLSESFNRLPDPVKAKARERTLLVLAKANSRATVHRPAYLDYVGVKTFDAAGEVTGERRFLGLFSSAAYTESLLRIPLAREKAQAVLARSGFDPQSHAGKALLDTLETYPRDDLFHTPVEELGPLVEMAMQARERRAVRMFIRQDTYGRYVSVLVYLPRDRYNTDVREKFVADPQGPPRRRLGGVQRPHQRVHDRPRALRGPPPEGQPAPRRRHRRPRAAPGRGVPLVARRLHLRRHRRVRRGGRRHPGPALPRLVPGGLQGGLLAAHRLGRPRSARGDRRRGGARPVALPVRRRRSRRGAAQALPDRCAALAVGDPADAVVDGCRGRRRASLRAHPASSDRRTSTSSACATRRSCPRRRASCSRTPSARCGTGTPRSTGSTPSSSVPG